MCALRIVVDDGCDVPPDVVARYRMRVVPLVVRFGDVVFADGRLSLDDFWARARNGSHPQTSQPASGTFQQVFRELVEAGDEVLCIVITSKHSGTFNSAWLAAQQFPGKVTVFDSLSITWGAGFLALKAAEAVESGAPLAEILRRLEAFRSNIQFPILLNTIEDIRRGGRADQLIPVVERLLQVFNIKPILTFVDGQLKILGTARSYERGLSRLLELMEARAPYQELALFHTRQPEAAQAFAERLVSCLGFPRERLYVSEVGPALATHAGPLAMGVIGVPAGI